MLTEYMEVLNNIKFDDIDSAMLLLRRKVMAITATDAEQLIADLQNKAGLCTDLRPHPKFPYFCLFSSYAYRVLSKCQDAILHAKRAKGFFRLSGLAWNEAMACWLLGLLYRDNGNPDHARVELKAAYEAIEQLANNAYVRGDYEGCDCCKKLLDQLKFCENRVEDVIQRRALPVIAPPPLTVPPSQESVSGFPQVSTTILIDLPIDINTTNQNQSAIDIQAINQNQPQISVNNQNLPELNVTNRNQPTFNPQISMPINTHSLSQIQQPLFSEPISLPAKTLETEPEKKTIEEIFNFAGFLTLPWIPTVTSVQAGKNGPIWAPQLKTNQVGLPFITIKDDLYTIHPIKSGGRRLTLQLNKEYSWAPVLGQSMNKARLKIEEGDYILFETTLGPSARKLEEHDIVIISQPTATGYTYMVKQYWKNENMAVSQTTEVGSQYDPIQVDKDHQIMGIVIAVAKKHKR